MARRALILIPALALVAAGTASGFACSAGNDPDPLGTGGTGTGGNGTGNSAATGGSVTGGGGTGGEGFDAGQTDGDLTDGDTCAATEAQAEKIPLDVFIVVDRSGSMSSKWTQTVAALNSFFNSPLSAGINVGMNLFPSVNTISNECDTALYNPIQTPSPIPPLATLPADAAMLGSVLSAASTGGTTPMYGALHGTYQVATAWQDANLDHKAIVVFTSDGDPCCGDCNTFYGGAQYETIATTAGLSQSAFNYNGVETYVIAIQGSSIADLNTIASMGGTGQAYDVTNDITLFAQKMEEIRSAALGCEYIIPEPEPPEVFDPLKVNVLYTPGGGGDQQTIPQADDLADCSNGDGWYFDDPVTPSRIILCPATCQDIQSDSEALVNIAFGCPTEVN